MSARRTGRDTRKGEVDKLLAIYLDVADEAVRLPSDERWEFIVRELRERLDQFAASYGLPKFPRNSIETVGVRLMSLILATIEMGGGAVGHG